MPTYRSASVSPPVNELSFTEGFTGRPRVIRGPRFENLDPEIARLFGGLLLAGEPELSGNGLLGLTTYLGDWYA